MSSLLRRSPQRREFQSEDFFFLIFWEDATPRSSISFFIATQGSKAMGFPARALYKPRVFFQKLLPRYLGSGILGAGLAVWTAGERTVRVQCTRLWSDQLVGIEVGLELFHPKSGL
jgi:hypothetical protein